MFERYDWKIGCLAVRKDDHWYVVYPNGRSERARSEEDARATAQFINFTADDEERETWR